MLSPGFLPRRGGQLTICDACECPVVGILTHSVTSGFRESCEDYEIASNLGFKHWRITGYCSFVIAATTYLKCCKNRSMNCQLKLLMHMRQKKCNSLTDVENKINSFSKKSFNWLKKLGFVYFSEQMTVHPLYTGIVSSAISGQPFPQSYPQADGAVVDNRQARF